MKHRKIVLEEVVRQKNANEYPNSEKLSAVSANSSKPDTEKARKLGTEDEKEKDRIWAPKKPEETKPIPKTSANPKGKSKRKSSFFGLFKKK